MQLINELQMCAERGKKLEELIGRLNDEKTKSCHIDISIDSISDNDVAERRSLTVHPESLLLFARTELEKCERNFNEIGVKLFETQV